MDKQIKAILERVDNVTLFTIQLTVLTEVVKALIATHPHPSEMKRAFDQFYGRTQASSALMQFSPDASALARHFVDGLFPVEP